MEFLIVTLFAGLAVAAQEETRRVFSGIPATEFQFPYQAGLILEKYKHNNFCGGSLISSTRVLTAGHCFEDIESIIVVLGAQIIEVEEPTQVRFKVLMGEVIFHPEYDTDTLYNDLAMIKLPSAVEFNDAISPITLAEGSNDYVDATGIISGWGHFDDTKKYSLFLRFADMKVITNSKCDELFGDIIDSVLCAQGQGDVGGCEGDSGGPLAIQANGEPILIGVLSFVAKCNTNKPLGCTRITSFLPWIKSNM